MNTSLRVIILCQSIFLSFQVHRSEGSSANRIVANLDQKGLEVPCTIQPNLTFQHLGWFSCSTIEECRSSLDEHRIAHIFNISTVVVTPLIGSREFITLLEISEESPRIVCRSPQTFYVVKGMKLVLECDAVGYPLPQVTWTRDHELLKNETGTDANFVREIANMEDSGSYVCRAQNSLGFDNHTIQVTAIDIKSCSTSPPPGKEDLDSATAISKLFYPLLLSLFLLLLIAVAIIIYLVWRIKKSGVIGQNHPNNCRVESGDDNQNVPGQHIANHAFNLEDIPKKEDGAEEL
ncbi:leucine-rich repeats and immunoglobulin-like domains protein 2 isoform X2 [Stylophora pistillata]|uniref:leucine-rich repeats and immunoglobulin-like domains protein 2 isoform X2 n=1 Tax=Stylophora pistillata TaxID=50429 RepID=UPI000C047414|nr:leucine-rich repeats and immunoglobulin-like domains protein 2 isoform X2 [Stylophora pistillata]